MICELRIPRSKGDVQTAIFQFLARRGLPVRKRWWSEDHWALATAEGKGGEPIGQVALSFERKRGATLVKIEPQSDAASIDLAYSLRVYLESADAYRPEVPTACPKCQRAVTRARANYCGVCGERLNPASVSSGDAAVIQSSEVLK